mmetsp:Transcript_9818/g.17705  ORF Transcript_9818/g.17705 Transcript_9818/m.17705 type:complete len:166 (+) Transcript_9818:1-498(+)
MFVGMWKKWLNEEQNGIDKVVKECVKYGLDREDLESGVDVVIGDEKWVSDLSADKKKKLTKAFKDRHEMISTVSALALERKGRGKGAGAKNAKLKNPDDIVDDEEGEEEEEEDDEQDGDGENGEDIGDSKQIVRPKQKPKATGTAAAAALSKKKNSVNRKSTKKS